VRGQQLCCCGKFFGVEIVVDRLVPLAHSFIEPGGAPVEVAKAFDSYLGSQTAQQELSDRVRVTHDTIVPKDKSTLRFKGGERSSSVLAVEEVAHDRRIKRRENGGTREQFLLCWGLSMEEDFNLEVESLLFFRQLLVGLVQPVAEDLSEVEDQPGILLDQRVELFLGQPPQFDFSARDHRGRAWPVGKERPLAEPFIRAVHRN